MFDLPWYIWLLSIASFFLCPLTYMAYEFWCATYLCPNCGRLRPKAERQRGCKGHVACDECLRQWDAEVEEQLRDKVQVAPVLPVDIFPDGKQQTLKV